MTQEVYTPSTRVLPFSKAVAALTKVTEDRQCYHDCDLFAAYFHFPPGPNGLVEVRVLIHGRGGDQQAIPSPEDSFLALDNTTLPVTGLAIPVNRGDNIRVEWNNYDGANAHRIPVEILLREYDRSGRPHP